MTREQKRTAIFFGLFMGLYSLVESLIQADTIDKGSIVSASFRMLLSGSIMWLLYYLPARFIKTESTGEQEPKIELDPNESKVLQCFGTHLQGIETVGGKLVLTEKRLVFKSHKLNIQTHELSIPLTDIVSASGYKKLGLRKNGLAITTSNGLVEKFTVDEPSAWVQELTSATPLQA